MSTPVAVATQGKFASPAENGTLLTLRELKNVFFERFTEVEILHHG